MPFLILFHNTDDTDIVETYNNEVAKQLLSEKCKCFGMSLGGVTCPTFICPSASWELSVAAVGVFMNINFSVLLLRSLFSGGYWISKYKSDPSF